MAQVYFHCSNAREIRIDQSGALVSDLTEARDRAATVVRSLIMARAELVAEVTVSVSNANPSRTHLL